MGIFMKNIHWLLLLYAVLAVTSMIGIGIAISYQSLTFIAVFIVILFLSMGLGFQTQKRLREAGKL